MTRVAQAQIQVDALILIIDSMFFLVRVNGKRYVKFGFTDLLKPMNSYSVMCFHLKVPDNLMLPYENIFYALTVIDHVMPNVEIF